MNPKNRKPGTSRANAGEAILDLRKGRICSKCKKYKERGCFYPHPTGFNGLGSKCKECFSLEPISPKKKVLYLERKNNNLCVKCGKQALETNVFCRNCWFADRASYRLGSAIRVNDLINLWDNQNGKCFYTDQDLIPGKNASIDHQTPSSKGGSDDIDNLRWVTNEVNMIKSSLSHEEFILFCKNIAEKFK